MNSDERIHVLEAELVVSNTIRDAARAECNRLLEDNRKLRLELDALRESYNDLVHTSIERGELEL